jgi:hypothetical protein
LRYYRIPPRYDHTLARFTITMIPYALVLHCMFGIWFFTSPLLVADTIWGSSVDEAVSDLTPLHLGARLSQFHVIPLVLLLLVLVVFLVLRRLCGCMRYDTIALDSQILARKDFLPPFSIASKLFRLETYHCYDQRIYLDAFNRKVEDIAGNLVAPSKEEMLQSGVMMTTTSVSPTSQQDRLQQRQKRQQEQRQQRRVPTTIARTAALPRRPGAAPTGLLRATGGGGGAAAGASQHRGKKKHASSSSKHSASVVPAAVAMGTLHDDAMIVDDDFDDYSDDYDEPAWFNDPSKAKTERQALIARCNTSFFGGGGVGIDCKINDARAAAHDNDKIAVVAANTNATAATSATTSQAKDDVKLDVLGGQNPFVAGSRAQYWINLAKEMEHDKQVRAAQRPVPNVVVAPPPVQQQQQQQQQQQHSVGDQKSEVAADAASSFTITVGGSNNSEDNKNLDNNNNNNNTSNNEAKGDHAMAWSDASFELDDDAYSDDEDDLELLGALDEATFIRINCPSCQDQIDLYDMGVPCEYDCPRCLATFVV